MSPLQSYFASYFAALRHACKLARRPPPVPTVAAATETPHMLAPVPCQRPDTPSAAPASPLRSAAVQPAAARGRAAGGAALRCTACATRLARRGEPRCAFLIPRAILCDGVCPALACDAQTSVPSLARAARISCISLTLLTCRDDTYFRVPRPQRGHLIVAHLDVSSGHSFRCIHETSPPAQQGQRHTRRAPQRQARASGSWLLRNSLQL